jgi:phospholipid/cholesterol/gamma-HCH transport system substrate-binding protein
MNDSRFQWKVGFFVLFGLALSALLVLNFSKGITFGKPTYRLDLTMPNVAGLKPAADVMMAGVPIGKVMATTLDLDGRSVDITVRILAKYQIHTNAVFRIDSLGILGDQYVEVTPAEEGAVPSSAVPFLKDGDKIAGEPPFNMQEAVRSVSGLLDQARKAMKDVDQAITNINRTILGEASLAKIGGAISNFEAITTSATGSAAEVRGMLDADGPPLRTAITNFVNFSDKLNAVTAQLGETISTNSGEVTVAVKNLREASEAIKQITDGLQAGHGVAGSLLKDEKMKTELESLVTNANAMTEQFSLFGLHLNERGIFRMLLKPKPAETNAPAR